MRLTSSHCDTVSPWNATTIWTAKKLGTLSPSEQDTSPTSKRCRQNCSLVPAHESANESHGPTPQLGDDRTTSRSGNIGFFEDLDRQLGRERGPNGEPFTNDFQTLDLFRIVEHFATKFDSLPETHSRTIGLPSFHRYRIPCRSVPCSRPTRKRRRSGTRRTRSRYWA